MEEPDGREAPSGPAELPGDAGQAGAGEPPLCCCPGPPAGPAPGPPPPPLEPPTLSVELPPCHGPRGIPLGELPLTEPAVGAPRETAAAAPPEPPRELPPRGKCLLHNWQEERATNPLDRVPGAELGPEGFFFRHGHRGLLSLHFHAGLARSSTAADSYRPPRPTGMPLRGQREAQMEWLLYQKHSKEVFEGQVEVPPAPVEYLSTTHQDYCQEGFISVPPAPTKPHDYRLEQPQTFWMDNARRVPGVSWIQTVDQPFRKCAAFTTPATEYLEQPHSPGAHPEV